jgi:predicted nucleic acid-binding protein
MTDEPVLIDSNILVYVFDKSEPEKQKVCTELLDKCWNGEREFAVSVQNLSEFYVIATNKIENPISKKTARIFVTSVVRFQNWKVLNFDAETIVDAIKLNETYDIHYWDAVLAATMKEYGIFSIYTEDHHFSKIRWIETINPMKQARRGLDVKKKGVSIKFEEPPAP